MGGRRVTAVATSAKEMRVLPEGGMPCLTPSGLLDFHHVFDRADGVTALAGFGRFVGHRHSLPARSLINAFARHLLDEKIREGPDQRIDAIGGISCIGAIEIRSEGTHRLRAQGTRRHDESCFARRAQRRVPL
jgi:hypothetical protein